jgi:hypothetical protein
VLGHILPHGVQYRVYVAHALGIAGQFELAGGIDGYEHYRRQYGDDAYDYEHFYQGEAISRTSYLIYLKSFHVLFD